MVEASDS
jgi:alpha-aminoadipic semialdehyde synthase